MAEPIGKKTSGWLPNDVARCSGIMKHDGDKIWCSMRYNCRRFLEASIASVKSQDVSQWIEPDNSDPFHCVHQIKTEKG